MPVIVPQKAGWAISETYVGPADAEVATPKLKMNYPAINILRFIEGAWMQVPITTVSALKKALPNDVLEL